MKIWLDDLMDDRESNRRVPQGFKGAHSVNEAIELVEFAISHGQEIEMVDLDHDLGDYAKDGGDGKNFLHYLREHEIFPRVKLHTSNSVGWYNMRNYVNDNWPEEYHILEEFSFYK